MYKPLCASLLHDTFGSEHQFKRRINEDIKELAQKIDIYSYHEQARKKGICCFPLRNDEISIEDIFYGGKTKSFQRMIKETIEELKIVKDVILVIKGKKLKETVLIAINMSFSCEDAIGLPYIVSSVNIETEFTTVAGLWKNFVANIKRI